MTRSIILSASIEIRRDGSCAGKIDCRWSYPSARIEEMVGKARKEVDQTIKRLVNKRHLKLMFMA